jgi:hypothetical protein
MINHLNKVILLIAISFLLFSCGKSDSEVLKVPEPITQENTEEINKIEIDKDNTYSLDLKKVEKDVKDMSLNELNNSIY